MGYSPQGGRESDAAECACTRPGSFSRAARGQISEARVSLSGWRVQWGAMRTSRQGTDRLALPLLLITETSCLCLPALHLGCRGMGGRAR